MFHGGLDGCDWNYTILLWMYCIIFANCHFVGIRLSSRKTVISPTLRLLGGSFHLVSFLRLTIYPIVSKNGGSNSGTCYRRNKVTGRNETEGSGKDSRAFPTRRCPRVRGSRVSSTNGRGVRGRLLRHASIDITQ